MMASNQQASPAGNSPAFRTRGLSLVLVCVLMINVLLVVVAPTLRPEEAAAQDEQPAVAEKVEATQAPETVQIVESTTQATAKEDNETSLSTNEVSTPRIAKNELQNQPAETPREVTVLVPPKVNGPEVVADKENPAQSPPTKVEGLESDNEAVVHTDARPDTKVEEPKVEVQREVAKLAPVTLPELLVVNPADSGGTVFYLVDGEVHSLAPGETLSLEEGRNHRIEFHRGEEHGDAEVMVSTGTYHFRVDDNGWNLKADNESRKDG